MSEVLILTTTETINSPKFDAPVLRPSIHPDEFGIPYFIFNSETCFQDEFGEVPIDWSAAVEGTSVPVRRIKSKGVVGCDLIFVEGSCAAYPLLLNSEGNPVGDAWLVTMTENFAGPAKLQTSGLMNWLSNTLNGKTFSISHLSASDLLLASMGFRVEGLYSPALLNQIVAGGQTAFVAVNPDDLNAAQAFMEIPTTYNKPFSLGNLGTFTSRYDTAVVDLEGGKFHFHADGESIGTVDIVDGPEQLAPSAITGVDLQMATIGFAFSPRRLRPFEDAELGLYFQGLIPAAAG